MPYKLQLRILRGAALAMLEDCRTAGQSAMDARDCIGAATGQPTQHRYRPTLFTWLIYVPMQHLGSIRIEVCNCLEAQGWKWQQGS